MTTEAEEIDELTTMFQSTGGVTRDSPITASKYNRWLVGEQNRGAGGVVRGEVQELRKDRMTAAERHREYGASLKNQSRDQLNRDKQQYELTRETNLEKGLRVKAEVMAQKAQEEKQKQEWIAHGKNLAMKDQLQRQKIKQVCGENSKRVGTCPASHTRSRGERCASRLRPAARVASPHGPHPHALPRAAPAPPPHSTAPPPPPRLTSASPPCPHAPQRR